MKLIIPLNMYAPDEDDPSKPSLLAPCTLCIHMKISTNKIGTRYCKYRPVYDGGLDIPEITKWGIGYFSSCDDMKYNDKRIKLI